MMDGSNREWREHFSGVIEDVSSQVGNVVCLRIDNDIHRIICDRVCRQVRGKVWERVRNFLDE